jgi:hypothetical protein
MSFTHTTAIDRNIKRMIFSEMCRNMAKFSGAAAFLIMEHLPCTILFVDLLEYFIQGTS